MFYYEIIVQNNFSPFCSCKNC